jgi:translation elongation factor EF-1alpha
MAKEKQIGKITHYFNKINVGVIELSEELKTGDKIHILGGEERDFEQEVESIQIEHENVEKAGKGEAVGFKVEEAVKPGDKVFKVLE